MAPERAYRAARGALLALALVAGPASASVFVCTAPSGKRITSDRPPPECAGVPIRELRPDGTVRRVIEPPPTEEQLRTRAEQERREYLEREARRAQARRDIALMETYASEEEIEAARQAALASRQAIIDRSRQRISEFDAERVKLEQEAEFYVNRKLPDKLGRAIESNKDLTAAELRLIGEMEAEMARINSRFDAQAERFRVLLNGGARPLMRTGESGVR